MNALSCGSLNCIIEGKNDRLRPVLQILQSRRMRNGKIRIILNDGERTASDVLLVSTELLQMYAEKKLEPFTVVRIDRYELQDVIISESGETKTYMSILDLMVLRQANALKRKLVANEPYIDRHEEGDDELSDLDLDEDDIVAAAGPSTKRQATEANVSKCDANNNQGDDAPPLMPTERNSIYKFENYISVGELSPHLTGWIVRVRVISKSPVKPFSSARGSGKLFSFDVQDERGEIRITAFNAACDKFFDQIQLNGLYFISRATVKPANKRFSNLKNDFELTLDEKTVIKECTDDVNIPTVGFNFTPIRKIPEQAEGANVDVIGVIRTMAGVETATSRRTGKEYTKKEFTLVDDSMAEVKVTLFNEMAGAFLGEVGQVVAMKNLVVGEFQGRNLTTQMSSVIKYEPTDLPQTAQLRAWYDQHGASATFTTLTSLAAAAVPTLLENENRLICQINPKLVTSEANVYSNFTGTIFSINPPAQQLYKACPAAGCMKKLTEEMDPETGKLKYYCAKCNKTLDEFIWKLAIGLTVADATGDLRVTVFQDYAERLLGYKTEELVDMLGEGNSGAKQYEMMLAEKLRFKPFNFRVGSKYTKYNGEAAIRSSAYKVTPVVGTERAKMLMKFIDVLGKK